MAKLTRFLGLIVATTLLTASFSVSAGKPAEQAISQDYRQKAAAIAQSYHDAGILDGVVIVATQSEILYQGAFGPANIPFDISYTTNTKVRLASVSKPFTAALILRLEEVGLLSTEQTIAELLPEFSSSPAAEVTVDQLLSHRSGIPNYQYTPPYQAIQTRVLTSGMTSLPVDLDDMIGTFIDRPLTFTPGEDYGYSNSNYVLLQAIAEKATGQSFAQLLRTFIFDPLAMEGSGILTYRSVNRDLADGYVVVPGGFEAPLQAQFVGAAAPGGLYSTAGDMAKWFQALFSGGFFRNPGTLEKMTVPRAVAYNETSFIGYGLFTSLISVGDEQVKAIGHDGWGPPFTANLQYIPEKGLIVFAADSISGTGSRTYGETVRLGEDLVRAAYGLETNVPSQPADLRLAQLLASEGIVEGISHFESLVKSGKIEKPREQDINGFGYALLGAGDLDRSIAVFRLNSRLFPDSTNAFDSLGETYEKAGQWANSISSYQEALRLSPDSSRLQEALQRIEALQESARDSP
ncbi:serine hydrolase domain-containing protein [Qipengyuania seohaensis]|uniref:serine hydrolase domain-containing protein n=1 Tax=Qipengyuania seohaensis TaxID=266951 RepID=UPI000C223469|nr:serine hydrolase domain-containing protein [Qipengyuania seohaensis]